MVRVCCVMGCLAGLVADGSAKAADLSKPVVSQNPGFDWSGWYVGGHVGDAAGRSDWSATPANGIPSAGSTELTNGFNLFKGNGSYFGGIQGGYNFVLPSRVLFGVEADASFPSSVAGTSASNAGLASYADTVLHLGTVR